MQWLYILNESLVSAFRTITNNKLRTFLSLLGVTIGIFSIISVFSVLDSMKANMKSTVEAFGNDIIVVEKWPWIAENGTDFAWWEYMNRPVTNIREYEELKKRTASMKAACFIAAIQTNVKYLDNEAENLQIWGITGEFEAIRSFTVYNGRFLNSWEISSGKNSCMLGYNLAAELFRDGNPVGKSISIKGKRTYVAGVFGKEGKSIIAGGSLDDIVLLPVGYLSSLADINNDRSSPQIWVKPAEGVEPNTLRDELRLNMRSIRRLGPRAKDNFALNKTVLMSTGIDQIFKVVNVAGWFIGIFAVLIGAFGIANIMFVSVKERTSIIGIQKALGAKDHYIILEVLYESVFLSVAGGIFGLLLVYLGILVARSQDFAIAMNAGNIVLGLLLSTTVGILAGFVPAFSAASLNPVKAIASTF